MARSAGKPLRASAAGASVEPRASASGSRAATNGSRSSASGTGSLPPSNWASGKASASVRRDARSAASASVSPRNVRVARARPPSEKRATQPGPSLRERLGAARARSVALWTRLRRPLGIAFKTLLVCAGLLGAVALGRTLQRHLLTSPAFAVDRIEVKGLVRMERAELLDAAGLALGRNVFERSPGEVKAQLSRHPWIAQASVTRRLPGSYILEVREREPVALLVVEPCRDANLRSENDPACDDGSALYLLSDDGKLFKRFDAKDPVDLPVITGVDRVRFGADPEFPKTVLLGVAQLLSDYRGQGLAQRLPISEIHLEANDGFSLYVGSELTLVRLGAPPFAQKLPRLKKVFARLEREHASAEYIYLDNEERPDRATVRLR